MNSGFELELDRAQAEAVASEAPTVLVVGGAGTGKTEVVFHRALHLVRSGVDPAGILLLLPNLRAARTMAARLESCGAGGVNVSTAPQMGVRILRSAATLFGRTERFVIHDREDAIALTAELLEDLDSAPAPEDVVRLVWAAKLASRPIEELVSRDRKSRRNGIEARLARGKDPVFPESLREVYDRYEESLRGFNAFDRPDLSVKAVEALDRPDFPSRAGMTRWRQVIVDDFQNLSPSEQRLCRLLATGGGLFVAADEDQTIQVESEATPELVLDFRSALNEGGLVELDRCYRSTGTLARAANEISARNRRRLPKVRTPTREAGPPIRVMESWDERGESADVERRLRELQKAGARLGDIAIICRSPGQFRPIEEMLRKLVIPHRVYGANRYFEQKEVKDLLAYLKIIVNPADLLSLRRVINVPRRGIGRLTLQRVHDYADRKGLDLFSALNQATKIDALPKNSVTKIKKFCDLIGELSSRIRELDASQVLDRIVEETGYVEEIHQQNVADRGSREAVVRDLQRMARDFAVRAPEPWADRFLEEVSLLTDADRFEPDPDVLSLMTIDVARGHDFRHVIVPGVEEGLIPDASALGNPETIEEERRFFHVAISRSRDTLTLCHARNRKRAGVGFSGKASRFVDEIPEECREHVQTFERENEIFEPENTNDLPPPGAGEWVRFEIGDRVRHANWGVGKVLETEGLGQDLKLTIHFESQGLKRLLLRYAKLEKLM